MNSNVTETDKEYKEIRGRRLNNFSQLQKFSILRENNEYLFNIFRSYTITDNVKNNIDYIVLRYVENDAWLENIAYNHYENENLWWVIAMTNDMVNPFEELEEGDQIKIIDERWLYYIVKEVKALSE